MLRLMLWLAPVRGGAEFGFQHARFIGELGGDLKQLQADFSGIGGRKLTQPLNRAREIFQLFLTVIAGGAHCPTICFSGRLAIAP